MKKIVLALAVLLGSAGMVVAEENNEVVDNQEVLDSNSGDDGWTGVYGNLGLGWEWFENKGDFVYDAADSPDVDPVLKSGSMDKQKNNRFYGSVGVGGQILFAQHFLAGLEFDCTFAKSEDKNAELKDNEGKNFSESGREEFHIKNKGVSPALYAKLGYVFCNKHAVYGKFGVKWIKTRVEDKNSKGGDESFDSNKGVFAAALGYQCAFSKNFSGYVEVNYAGRNKVDHGSMNEGAFDSLSLKTNESNWGFGAGVSVRFPISQSN